ncbi:phytanoyl-CoA dioxygenase family protein [Paenibacillus eucommiae]|uniref:Ectoine hydroxylase-related dioxygenase (Phytanoyl-CoA dioxygenase family) n=1 Tax=Paenibacillus eucommiae TaxID=1355755 RepID=A0ABS4IVW5_9BACL|nr:phytanoyl-CoA dioxygenase family protein [Paenibacillus eucommiae]MBP1991141.1 ectoine hydroxylase-related dioxygenase (phytanoyl-CoA dioxygenase family) [Paenibacillus eucommiae]
MIDFLKFRKISDLELEEHSYNMQIRGFTMFQDFIDDQLSDYLREKLMVAIENYKPIGSERSVLDKYLLHDLVAQDVIFAKLLEDPRLQAILSVSLDPYWIMYAFTSSSLPPRGVNYGSRLHVDSPRLIPDYAFNIGVMWALDDFTLENGGTKLLPGSHNSSIVPDNNYFEQNCHQIICKKGTFIVFNARVWHRAGENKTEHWRHSLTMNACRPYMKQRLDWVRLIPEEISNKLNDQARRIIGFDTRLPTKLEEFFVEDDQRLYKPNQG